MCSFLIIHIQYTSTFAKFQQRLHVLRSWATITFMSERYDALYSSEVVDSSLVGPCSKIVQLQIIIEKRNIVKRW